MRSRLISVFLFVAIVINCNVGLPLDATSQAIVAVDSFLGKFWNQQIRYLEDTYPSKGVKTQYWVAAEGYQTLVDFISVLKNNTYQNLIDEFYTSQNSMGWSRDYYDDEAWMANALITAYQLTGQAKYLNTAQSLLSDIQSAWDTSCCGSVKGGTWWDKSHSQKATASNAGGVVVGARMYQIKKDPSILAWCEKVYWFWYDNMVNQQTGQVGDHINKDGSKVWWKFTYNEGLMIGSAVELYQITNNVTYLQHAQKIGNFMIANEVQSNQYGKVLFDGNANSCGGDCMEFKGPGFKFLAQLYLADKANGKAYLDVLTASASSLWNIARDTQLNLFGVDWTQSYSHPTQTYQSQQNAATMALIHFAGVSK